MPFLQADIWQKCFVIDYLEKSHSFAEMLFLEINESTGTKKKLDDFIKSIYNYCYRPAQGEEANKVIIHIIQSNNNTNCSKSQQSKSTVIGKKAWDRKGDLYSTSKTKFLSYDILEVMQIFRVGGNVIESKIL